MLTQPTRRSFIMRMTGAAACLSPVIASAGQANVSRDHSPKDEEDYWQQIRRQFPFREAKVPMNAANLCPSPRSVAQRVTQLTRDIDVDCSFQNRDMFHRLLEMSRQKVAGQLKVSPDEIALVRNTSEANNTINNGLALSSGDEIVIWDQNHPTNNIAWDVRAARFGLKVKRVGTPAEPRGVDQLVRVFTDSFTPRTRVLAITHVSNSSGVRLPVRELCQVARPKGIYVHVDGAQTWGALDVNLRHLECDSYAASAHKWFVGPKEVGLLYVRQENIEKIWPNVVAPGWGEDVAPDVVGARKFESLGQRDDAALAAVADTVDFHQAIGAERIERRLLQLASRLKQQLADKGMRLVTPLDMSMSAGVCIVDVPPKQQSEVFETLYHKFGIAGSTTGGFRLCPHIYNTFEHIDRASRGLLSLGYLTG